MALKFWQGEQEHAVRTLERSSRITKLTTSELKEWLDIEIRHLGQAYDQWRHHSRGADEVSTRLDMLAAMWDELSERDE